MATTWIKPLKISKTMGKSTSIADIIDYVNNPLKTDDGKLISSYCCSGFSADRSFLYAKREYEKKTGRSQGRRDVIAYHIRQSFKPGEVDPEAVCCRGCFLRTPLLQHGSQVIRSSMKWHSEGGAIPNKYSRRAL